MDYPDATLGTKGAGQCADCGQHSPGRWPGERCRACWDVRLNQRRQAVNAGPTALYRLYTADGYLLYIGISINPKRRLKEHRRAEWWPDVDTERTVIEWLDCGGHAAELIELAAIRAEYPWHNKAGLHDPNGEPWELPPGCPPYPSSFEGGAGPGWWVEWEAMWALWWAAVRDCVLNWEEREALGR